MKEKDVKEVVANLQKKKKWREKKSQNEKGMVGRIVTIKCRIMGRRRARNGGECL
jgi:hypothetical protein